MEYLDVVNEDDEVVGQKPRSECHGEQPERHRSVSIISFRTDKKQEILVQKRSDTKERKPGRLEVTGGHLHAGEDYREAALREYAEELYCAEPREVSFSPEDLEFLFKIYKESHDNREFVEVYETVNPGPFELLDEEVEDAWFADIGKLADLVEREPERFTHAAREVIKNYSRGREKVQKATAGL